MDKTKYTIYAGIFQRLEKIEKDIALISYWAAQAVNDDGSHKLSLQNSFEPLRSSGGEGYPGLRSIFSYMPIGPIEFGTREPEARKAGCELDIEVSSSVGLHIAEVLLAEKVLQREKVLTELEAHGIKI